jgi:hypothetical protein
MTSLSVPPLAVKTSELVAEAEINKKDIYIYVLCTLSWLDAHKEEKFK